MIRFDLDKGAFELAPELEASEPPEARGLARDEVRLMVSYRTDNRIIHTRFCELPSFLAPGDVLVRSHQHEPASVNCGEIRLIEP